MVSYLITGCFKLTEPNLPNDLISRSKLPIFFCPGAVTEGDKKVAFEAGAQGYFGRPFDTDEITVTYAPP
jgi:CheY-like chemotaxis protein